MKGATIAFATTLLISSAAFAFGARPPQGQTQEQLQEQTQGQTVVGQPGSVVVPNPFGNPGAALGNQMNEGNVENNNSGDNDQ